MEQKKFMDIQRLKEGYADGFMPGDLIVIQEKFDGSNAAARYDAETGRMVAFSRRQTLDQNNTFVALKNASGYIRKVWLQSKNCKGIKFNYTGTYK